MAAGVKLVEDHAKRIFTWNYDRERVPLVTLYDKGVRSQRVTADRAARGVAGDPVAEPG